MTVRDGVELAMTVRLPRGKTLADGPFPTVIEYSGHERCPGAGNASPCEAARSEAESVTSCARLRIPLSWSG